MTRVGKVVVGVDGSPTSLRALWTAVEEARRRYSALHILYAAEEIGLTSAAAAAAGQLTDIDVERGRLVVEDALTELYGGRPGDIPIHLVVSRLPIRFALLSAVGSDDLLVVGRSRTGFMRRMIAGSVGQYCASRAPCPVLIVPPPQAPHRSYAIQRERKGIRH